jgi:uncharacterized protein (DUF2141 family)
MFSVEENKQERNFASSSERILNMTSIALAVKCITSASALCCALLIPTCLTAQTPATPTPAPAAAPTTTVPATTTLTIHITGIRNAKGRIGVALFKDAKGFPMDPSGVTAAKQADIDPQTLSAIAVFDKLPQGVYAAAVLHDEDLSGHMDFDAQGIPTKGYGISNNPATNTGPPTAEEAKFTADQAASSIDVKMTYWQ